MIKINGNVVTFDNGRYQAYFNLARNRMFSDKFVPISHGVITTYRIGYFFISYNKNSKIVMLHNDRWNLLESHKVKS